jgi:hypothetical protein
MIIAREMAREMARVGDGVFKLHLLGVGLRKVGV